MANRKYVDDEDIPASSIFKFYIEVHQTYNPFYMIGVTKMRICWKLPNNLHLLYSKRMTNKDKSNC